MIRFSGSFSVSEYSDVYAVPFRKYLPSCSRSNPLHRLPVRCLLHMAGSSLRAECHQIHNLRKQTIFRHLNRIVWITYQHITFLYSVYKPFGIKCRDVRPHSCLYDHVMFPSYLPRKFRRHPCSSFYSGCLQQYSSSSPQIM